MLRNIVRLAEYNLALGKYIDYPPIHQGGSRGYRGIQGFKGDTWVSWGYSGFQGVQGVHGGYRSRGIQRDRTDTGGLRGIQGDMVGFRGIQRDRTDTGGSRRIQADIRESGGSRGYRGIQGIQEVLWGYRGFKVVQVRYSKGVQGGFIESKKTLK